MNTMQLTSTKNEKADAQTSAFFNSQSTSAPIFGQSDKTIKAFCIASRPEWRHGRRNILWTLTVEKCPHCNQRHTHGGGDGAVPILGDRAAHCVDGRGGYQLVLKGGAA